jgi:carbon-monoxide dehydrogenase large subunit
MPRADDVPPIVFETVVVPSPNNSLGIKGLGELPANGAPAAVANAVMDALRPYGVRHLPSPMTAERVWRAMRGMGG